MSLIFKNIFWLTGSRAVALALLFLAYAQLFRYLGPFGSGQYQFVLNYVMIFSIMVDFGVFQFITKKMSEEQENIKTYFRNFLFFEVFASLVLFVLLVGIAYLKDFDSVVFKAVFITGLGMVANALCYPFLAVMTAKQDLKKVAIINFLNSLVNITIIFLAIYLKKYIIFLASIQLIFGILDLLLYKFFVRKHITPSLIIHHQVEGRGAGHFDFSIIKNILKSAWPFALLVGFSAIYNRVDVIIITKLLGYVQTGLYTSAYKFFDLLNFFPASVSHVLFPAFTALMAKNLIFDVKITLEKYLRLMIAVALPMAIGGAILSKKLILLVAGSEFTDASNILAILIWAIAILFIYIPINALVISQLTKKAMVITGVNVLVNIIGNIILIPIYGIKAPAIMTVVSEGIQGIFYFYFVRKNITKFAFTSILWKPLIASLVMGWAVWQVREMNLVIPLILGLAVYILVLILVGFIKKQDLSFVKNLIQNP